MILCNDYDDDDTYIMMKFLSVCLSRKITTSHFRAERRRREVSSPLGLAGFGLVMMMMMRMMIITMLTIMFGLVCMMGVFASLV